MQPEEEADCKCASLVGSSQPAPLPHALAATQEDDDDDSQQNDYMCT